MDGRDQKQSPFDMDMQLNLLPKERRVFFGREEGGGLLTKRERELCPKRSKD